MRNIVFIDKIKILKNSTTVRNGVLFSFFSFLNSGINFFLLFVLAGLISQEGYGKLNLFNTCITLITPIISLSTLGYVGISYFQNDNNTFINTIKSVCCVSIVVFLFLAGISCCMYSFWERWIGLKFVYVLYVLLICFIQIFTLLNLEIWRIKEKIIAYGIYSILLSLFNFFLTLIFVIFYQYGWLGRIYALMSGTILFGTGSFYLLWRYRYLNMQCFSWANITEILKFGLPLIPHQLSFWLRQGLDRFIINYYFASGAVGVFSFAYNFANIIMILGTAFNATNSIFIYKNVSSLEEIVRRRLRVQTKWMIGFFAVISILIILGAYFFTPMIFPQYSASVIYVIPLCISAFFHCVYLLFVNYLFYFRKTRVLMNITILCSIIHACLSLAFTRYDILITAYISLISNFLICIAVVLYSQKVYPIFKTYETK